MNWPLKWTISKVNSWNPHWRKSRKPSRSKSTVATLALLIALSSGWTKSRSRKKKSRTSSTWLIWNNRRINSLSKKNPKKRKRSNFAIKFNWNRPKNTKTKNKLLLRYLTSKLSFTATRLLSTLLLLSSYTFSRHGYYATKKKKRKKLLQLLIGIGV